MDHQIHDRLAHHGLGLTADEAQREGTAATIRLRGCESLHFPLPLVLLSLLQRFKKEKGRDRIVLLIQPAKGDLLRNAHLVCCVYVP